ncbi:hypothetical protein [Pseudomonas sp. ICMP 561]|uniref:hypothetical protein n=1 Tax=Pseudomonas sp. ICMP 561 TaxID=1718918 RepID=UPI000C071C7B|nr:hypothetical protein [Pseudomonas sp. ICMP 561]PHN17148.1 hypothetical protein AO242_20820 [Pseudomonas sp. ICMP 561]
MRVPIYASDLLPQASFQKLSKCIQNRWPGQSPITFSLARETLSRGLGYADYSEVRHLSLTCPPASPPSESDVCAGIAAALSLLLKSSADSSVKPGELESFVKTLPYKALKTFKALRKGSPQVTLLPTKASTKIDVAQGSICPVNATCPERPLPCYQAPTLTEIQRKSLISTWRQVNLEYLEAIRTIVERSENLRDQSIFAMLKSGLRTGIILSTKISDNTFGGGACTQVTYEFESTKPWPLTFKGNAGVVERYIASASLSVGDYLFPSKYDPKQPMSESELLQALQSWTKEAQISPPDWTVLRQRAK